MRGLMLPNIRKARIHRYKLASFDIETEGDNNEFLMGSVFYEDGSIVSHKTFWDKLEMISFLESKRFAGYRIFSTNLDFDFFALMIHPVNTSLYKMMFRGSRLIIVKFSREGKKKRTRLFLDTMNFYPVSVERLGRVIGLNKGRRPRAFGRRPKSSDERDELESYNLRDSEITFEFARWFQERLNALNIKLRPTIASCSLWNYRKNYMKVVFAQPNRQVMTDMLKAYYGGRTEAFVRGKISKCYLYDVNAMYPFVMTFEYPDTTSLKTMTNASMEDIERYHGVSFCNVQSPEKMRYPFLPYRKNKKLLFPLGRWRGWYSHIELVKAAELGYLIRPMKTYYYTRNCFPFTKIMTEYYELREKDKPNKLIYKLLANSLYGKFAQRWDDTLNYYAMDSLKELPEGFLHEKSGYAIVKESSNPANHVNPIISIYTTAYGRIWLYNLITSYEAMYCDTDSVITRHKIPTSSMLGRLKLEKTVKAGIICRPKLYYLNDDAGEYAVKAKGFRIRTKDEFLRLIYSKKSRQFKMLKFRESIRRNEHTLKKIDYDKILDTEDDKRDWSERPFSPFVMQTSRAVRVDEVLKI